MKITLVAGARPNFVKIAPIIEAISRKKEEGANISYRLVHTGQHFDHAMSESFFKELSIPQPDENLNATGGNATEQTAAIMVAFERELKLNPCDLVLVVGDVNSTMACAIVSKKLNIPVAHVEAGIRSGDMTMPEEINRIVTDSISDLFFTTSTTACSNLMKAGIDKERIFFVGNVMIDSLRKNEKNFRRPKIFEHLSLEKQGYFVLTLHRPANVDDVNQLSRYLSEIIRSAHGKPVIFPVHPRTMKNLKHLDVKGNNLHMIEPLSYLEFNYLVKNALAVITDSGGITEEATVMQVPCLTLRDNTERPETVTEGTNELVGTDPERIYPAIQKVLAGSWKRGNIPEKWDGQASSRIVQILIEQNICGG